MQDDDSAVCPRCGASAIDTHAKSAVADVWTIFGCSTCRYTWRSTEPAENTDRERYPAVFRLSPQDIPHMPVVPAIPPLRHKD